MNNLIELRTKLQDTQTAIAQVQKAMATSPDPSALAVTLASLEARLKDLQERYTAEAAQVGGGAFVHNAP